jgi:hypothetical protein
MLTVQERVDQALIAVVCGLLTLPLLGVGAYLVTVLRYPPWVFAAACVAPVLLALGWRSLQRSPGKRP